MPPVNVRADCVEEFLLSSEILAAVGLDAEKGSGESVRAIGDGALDDAADESRVCVSRRGG